MKNKIHICNYKRVLNDIIFMYQRIYDQWILSHPFKIIDFGLSRLLYFMNFNREGGVWPIWYQYEEGHYDPEKPLNPELRRMLEELSLSTYYALFFMWLGGFYLLWRQWSHLHLTTRKQLLLIMACFVLYFGLHTLIYPIRKYRFPIEPLMMIFASHFFRAWAHKYWDFLDEKLSFGGDLMKKYRRFLRHH